MTVLTTATGPNRQNTPVAIFPDFEHMSAYLASKEPLGNDGYQYSESKRGLANGDKVLAERAEKILASIETESLYSDNVSQWGRSVSGAFPDVPAYLSGSPVNMRRRTPQHGLAPLTIVVETYMSGGISDAGRERRGVAILSLVRKLQMTGHAVDLWLAHTSRPNGLTATCLVRVENRPLDLARAVWGFAATFQKDGFKMASAQVLYNLRSFGSLMLPFNDSNFPNDPEKQTAYYTPILSPDNALLAIPSLCGRDSFFDTDASTRKWLDANYAKATAIARQQLAA